MTQLEHPQVARAQRTGYPEDDFSWTAETELAYATDNLADFIHWALNDEDIVRDFVESRQEDFYAWMEGRT